MAMLIEAYEAEGALALSKEFPLQFLDSLLLQTIELRRDPEDRIKEETDKAVEEYKARNIGKTIEFTSPTGAKRSFTLGSSFVLEGTENGAIIGGNQDTDIE